MQEFDINRTNKLRVSLVEGKLDVRTMYQKDGEWLHGKGFRCSADLGPDIAKAILALTGGAAKAESSAAPSAPASKVPTSGKFYCIAPADRAPNLRSKNLLVYKSKDNALDEHGFREDGLFIVNADTKRWRLLREWNAKTESWDTVTDNEWSSFS